MQIDCPEDIAYFRPGSIALGQEFDFATRDLCVRAELSCDRHKILLKNLQRNDRDASCAVFCDKVPGPPVFF